MVRFTIGDAGNPWKTWKISDAGSQENGDSTKLGDKGWNNGDPAILGRDVAALGGGVYVTLNSASTGTYLKPTGQYSAVFWFVTDATDYRITDFSIQDSGKVGSSHGYAPVPGPSVLLGLASLSGVGLGWGWRRRFMRR
jgi:hypothetical protein